MNGLLFALAKIATKEDNLFFLFIGYFNTRHENNIYTFYSRSAFSRNNLISQILRECWQTASNYLEIMNFGWEPSTHLNWQLKLMRLIIFYIVLYFIPWKLGWRPDTWNKRKVYCQSDRISALICLPATQVAPEGPGSIIENPLSHWNMICREFPIFLTYGLR